MGEFAIHNGERIKIGVCEDMYYLRFEDRDKVQAEPNSFNVNDLAQLHGLRFRIPFIDENNVLPGQYNRIRGLRLYQVPSCNWCNGTGQFLAQECMHCMGMGHAYPQDYQPKELINEPGRMQIHHEQSGLLLSVPCYHGLKLPDLGPECSVSWNGKNSAFELAMLKAVVSGNDVSLLPIIRCRFCGDEWSLPWEDIKDYLPEDYRFLLDRYAPSLRAA